MENDWPPLKDCIQIKLGMINHFLDVSDWEKAADLTSDEDVYYTMDDDDDEEDIKYSYKPTEVKRFLHQVRTSRGYYLDVAAPLFLLSPFMLVSDEKLASKLCQDLIYPAKGIIIDHINSKTNKVYKYVDTLKLVYSTNRIAFLTFIAKEDTDNAKEETFLASVFAPGLYGKASYKLYECFLKPEGPAPTELPKEEPEQEPEQKCECRIIRRGENIRKQKCELCPEKKKDKKFSKKNEMKEDKKILKKNEKKEEKKVSKKISRAKKGGSKKW